MNIQWTGAIEDRRIELLEQSYTYNQIAKMLSKEFNVSISRHAVKNRSVRSGIVRNKKSNTTIVPNKASINSLSSINNYSNQQSIINQQPTTKQFFPEECYNVEEEFCMTTNKLRELDYYYQLLTSIKPKKILSLSDLHSPCIDFSAVDQALFNNTDADIIVLNGDVLDCQAFSKFDKMDEFDLEVEINQVKKLFNVLCSEAKYVVWVGGNHDLKRFQRYVMKNFTASAKKLAYKRLNPMDILAEEFDNLIVIPHDWMMIGDVIFAHLEKFSSVLMKTVDSVDEVFMANKHLLPNENYNSIIIGHTHHLGSTIKNGRLLMEQGCLTHLQDYRFNQPTKTRWETGYAVIKFDDNVNIDVNESDYYYIGKTPKWWMK